MAHKKKPHKKEKEHDSKKEKDHMKDDKDCSKGKMKK